MNLTEFRAENFARIKVVEIRPNGALVPITGKNSNGKTSVLKGIWTLIEGRAAAPAVAIRKGQKQCTLYGDLGQYKITRTITATADGGESWDLKVVAHDGTKVTKSPQAVINAFKGDMGFDPLGWTRLPAKDQVAALRSLVDYDFDAAAKMRKAAYDERTVANRRRHDAEAAAAAIELPPGPMPKSVDIAAKIDELQQVAAYNSQLDRAFREAEAGAEQVEKLMDEAERLRARATTLENQAASIQARAADILKEWSGKQPKDAASLRADIDGARDIERVRELFAKRQQFLVYAKRYAELSDKYTADIDASDQAQHDAIAAAKLPVKGLSLGDDAVLLNGLPLAQAGTAEKIETALAIAMAKNPELKVILIDEGSELDSEAMAFVAKLAEAKGFQVWVARVDESREVGFVIEDGRVAS